MQILQFLKYEILKSTLASQLLHCKLWFVSDVTQVRKSEVLATLGGFKAYMSCMCVRVFHSTFVVSGVCSMYY